MSVVHNGSVESFDDVAGFGLVVDASSSRAYFFHCTEIADGSRTVLPGTDVTFSLSAGHCGRWEARGVRVGTSAEDSFACPVCGSIIVGGARSYEICGICGWEDDAVQYDDPTYARGANAMSLNDARTAWVKAQRSVLG